MDGIGFRFFRGDNRADILDEIDAALFAFAADALAIAARGAFKAQSGVAARTESRNFARIAATLGALIGGFRFLSRHRRCRDFCNGRYGRDTRLCRGCAGLFLRASDRVALGRLELTAHDPIVIEARRPATLVRRDASAA